MAEAFARAAGEDSMLVFSAGIRPGDAIAGVVREAMEERRVPMPRDQYPRPLSSIDLSCFDLIVNLSGSPLPPNSAAILEPLVPSPIAGDLDSHRAVRDRMEALVRFLVEHFGRAREWTPDLNRQPSETVASRTKPGLPPTQELPPDATTPAAF